MERTLASELTFADDNTYRGAHAWAFAASLLPLPIIGAALAKPNPSRALAATLSAHAADASVDRSSISIHHALAIAHGWPSLRGQLGREPITLIGMGRHAQLLTRNLHERVGAPLVIAGRDKVAARSLLVVSGLPVAPGIAVTNPDAAVAWAKGRRAVVVKGVTGGNGESVFLDLRDAISIRSATARVLAGATHAVVEEMVTGTEFRVHVVAGEVVAVFAPSPKRIVGDGAASIGALFAATHPDLWASVERTEWLRRRTVQHTWGIGARRWTDVARIVLERGTPLTVAPGTGSDMRAVPLDSVHRADRAAIEALFRRFGGASGALDLVVKEHGRALSDGGAVLDLNVPCGWAYLGRRIPDLANTELERWLPASFRAAHGRVPLLLVPTILGQQDDEVGQWFDAMYPRGRWHQGLDDRGWFPVLDDRLASALLVGIDEKALFDHGLPANAKPLLIDVHGQASPVFVDTVRRAGGAVHVGVWPIPADPTLPL